MNNEKPRNSYRTRRVRRQALIWTAAATAVSLAAADPDFAWVSQAVILGVLIAELT